MSIQHSNLTVLLVVVFRLITQFTIHSECSVSWGVCAVLLGRFATVEFTVEAALAREVSQVTGVDVPIVD